jgi:hypothetical protein
MKKANYLLLFILILTSCKTVRSITSKDNSSTPEQKIRNTRDITFVDGIEISPGSVVKSSHIPSTTKSKSVNYEVPSYLFNTASIDIEKATSLQFKYSLLLDTYVENLSNIKLYMQIDEWWGTSYCMGGSTKNCIDCSAFTSVIIKDNFNVNLPRTAAEQYKLSERIDKENLKEGDLVFFKSKKDNINLYMHPPVKV